MRRPGKPVTHPPIKNLDTGDIFLTYTAAADAIGGSRFGVMRTCYRMQKHHKGFHFIFVRGKEYEQIY